LEVVKLIGFGPLIWWVVSVPFVGAPLKAAGIGETATDTVLPRRGPVMVGDRRPGRLADQKLRGRVVGRQISRTWPQGRVGFYDEYFRLAVFIAEGDGGAFGHDGGGRLKIDCFTSAEEHADIPDIDRGIGLMTEPGTVGKVMSFAPVAKFDLELSQEDKVLRHAVELSSGARGLCAQLVGLLLPREQLHELDMHVEVSRLGLQKGAHFAFGRRDVSGSKSERRPAATVDGKVEDLGRQGTQRFAECNAAIGVRGGRRPSTPPS
jgi:hypothetical protein